MFNELRAGTRIARSDDARMADERMTVAVLAKELRSLSERVETGLAQVNKRFDTLGTDLEQFADKITTEFKINLERMEAKLDSALDDTREQARRLDVFERANAEEHRLMQAQIDDVDSRLPPRRTPRRRPS